MVLPSTLRLRRLCFQAARLPPGRQLNCDYHTTEIPAAKVACPAAGGHILALLLAAWQPLGHPAHHCNHVSPSFKLE